MRAAVEFPPRAPILHTTMLTQHRYVRMWFLIIRSVIVMCHNISFIASGAGGRSKVNYKSSNKIN